MGDFTILFDTEQKLLDVMITGIWNYENAHRFREAILAHGLRTDSFDMIVDIRAEGILPADATGEIEASLADLVQRGLRRAAYVTASALSTMQIRRIGGSLAVMAFFPTRADALDWLGAAEDAHGKQDKRS